MNISTVIVEKFYQVFPGSPPPLVVKSPGRINIIGEHVDYNDGLVLPAAINQAAHIAIALRDDDEIHLFANELSESFSISISDLMPRQDVSWPNYIIGVLAQFKKLGVALRGFNAVLSSDVPIGSGLSSSAAIECATAFALDKLFKTGLDKITLVKMAQIAEHEYADVMCGIMDQFSSGLGKKNHLIKLDCRDLSFEYIPFNFDEIKIVLLNTNVKHSLASSEYNLRKQECEQAVEWISEHEPSVTSLRDATETMLDKYVLPKSELVYRRSKFVVQEIKRLQDGCEALLKGDLATLGKKMFEAHDGLKNDYEVSCKELDWLVDNVKNNPDVIGARMMGGGFGGCTINLVKEQGIGQLIEKIKPAYEAAMDLPLTYYISQIENGTEIISEPQA